MAHEPTQHEANSGDDGSTAESIPPRLAARLQSLDRALGPVGNSLSELDDLILAVAAGEFAARRRRRMVLRIAAPLAAAAGLAVAVSVFLYSSRPHGNRAGIAVLDPGDLNGDGTVNIVDALVLARAVEQTTAAKLNGSWDFSHDGRVDRGDVDALAGRVVRVGLPGGSGTTTGGGAS